MDQDAYHAKYFPMVLSHLKLLAERVRGNLPLIDNDEGDASLRRGLWHVDELLNEIAKEKPNATKKS